MAYISPLSGAALFALVAGVLVPAASAEGLSVSLRTRIQAEAAIRLQDGDASLARVSAEPYLRIRGDKGWRADLSGRLIAAADETGLGTVSTFSSQSRPTELSPDVRLELDRALLTFSAGEHDFTIGKQALA